MIENMDNVQGHLSLQTCAWHSRSGKDFSFTARIDPPRDPNGERLVRLTFLDLSLGDFPVDRWSLFCGILLGEVHSRWADRLREWGFSLDSDVVHPITDMLESVQALAALANLTKDLDLGPDFDDHRCPELLEKLYFGRYFADLLAPANRLYVPSDDVQRLLREKKAVSQALYENGKLYRFTMSRGTSVMFSCFFVPYNTPVLSTRALKGDAVRTWQRIRKEARSRRA